MKNKFALSFFKRSVLFIFTFSLGVISFNLFQVKEKLQMIQVINEFHNGQLNNDKKLMDTLLTDNFVESGVKHFTQTPDAIYKSDIMNVDYVNAGVKSIEVKYLIPLNLFSNSNMSVSFVRYVNFLPEGSKTPSPFGYYVTYTFEKTGDGLKINKIERKL